MAPPAQDPLYVEAQKQENAQRAVIKLWAKELTGMQTRIADGTSRSECKQVAKDLLRKVNQYGFSKVQQCWVGIHESGFTKLLQCFVSLFQVHAYVLHLRATVTNCVPRPQALRTCCRRVSSSSAA